MNPRPIVAFSPYSSYSRDDWAALRADTPMPLTEAELENLGGLTERVSTREVIEVYLPLSRLLNLHVEALQQLHGAASTFLRNGDGKMPFIIGLAGSVAVGKSTTGRVLQALLGRWPSHPRVELVPTDGFLSQCRARSAPTDDAERGPGELRSAPPAQLPRRGEVGT
jgi:type I pantothenate kinase